MIKRTLKPEQELEIVRRYRVGEGSTVLARSFSVSVQTICNTLARLGVALRQAGGSPGKGRPKTLSIEQESAIVTSYAAGQTLQALAETYGVHAQTISSILERHGVEKRSTTVGQNRILTIEQETQIANALRTGACGRDLAASYGVSPSFISNIRRRADLAPGPIGRRVTRIVDHDAFKEITPTNCYWTGMLFADGGIDYDHGSPQIVLELARRDRKHVEKFRTFLKSDYAISDILHKNSYGRDGQSEGSAFRVRSQTIADALEARGLMVKKASRVPSAAMVVSRDFFRGLVDGDGWVGSEENKGYIYPHIGLSGQIPILEAFRKFLFDHTLFVPNIHPTDSGIWRVQTSGANAEPIIKCLYENNTVVLDRKNIYAQAIITGNINKLLPHTEGPSWL